MKNKVLTCLLLISSFAGYLEWGGDNHSFLIQAEMEAFKKFFADPTSVIHPLIILPLLGQVILVITLFQKSPSKVLTLTGLCSIGLLLSFMFVIASISLNYKILISTIPFLTFAFLIVRSMFAKTDVKL